MVSGKSELAKHRKGKKHLSNIKGLKGSQNIIVLTSNLKHEDKNKDIKSAEIKLSAYFANHNIAFQPVDVLTPVLQDIFEDSKVAQSLTLYRKKCTSIINNVIAPAEISETIEIIRTCPFSVLVDESTDISSHKFFCVLVHYVHPKAGTVHTRLLELVAIDATDGRAKKVYEEFKSCLQSKQIPIKNLVGMASDGANMMVGKNNSFFFTFEEKLPKSSFDAMYMTLGGFSCKQGCRRIA